MNQVIFCFKTLVFSALGILVFTTGLVAAPASSTGILGLERIIMEPAGEGAFYANNVELEPVRVILCGDDTIVNSTDTNPSERISLATSINDGHSEDRPLTLNDANANRDGFYLVSPASSYFSIYRKTGFSTTGGVFSSQQRSINSRTVVFKEAASNLCTALGFSHSYQYTVYLRAGRGDSDISAAGYIGKFALVGTAMGGSDGITPIKSRSDVNLLTTHRPISYHPGDFHTGMLNGAGTAYAPRDRSAQSLYTDQIALGQNSILDFGIKSFLGFNSSYHFLYCHSDHSLQQLIGGSDFSYMEMHCSPNFPTISSHQINTGLGGDTYTYQETVNLITIIGNHPPLQAMTATMENGVDGNNIATDFKCDIAYQPDEKQANRYNINNYYGIYYLNPSKTDQDVDSYNGGVGIVLPNSRSIGKHTYAMQITYAHNYNAKESDAHPNINGPDFGCPNMRAISLVGYDHYGNRFFMQFVPGLLQPSSGIGSKPTIQSVS